jgi:hypothetical protein
LQGEKAGWWLSERPEMSSACYMMTSLVICCELWRGRHILGTKKRPDSFCSKLVDFNMEKFKHSRNYKKNQLKLRIFILQVIV